MMLVLRCGGGAGVKKKFEVAIGREDDVEEDDRLSYLNEGTGIY